MRTIDYPMTRSIARRVLEYRARNGRAGRVTVQIGKPARDPGGPDWYCPYRIAGLGKERRFAAFGVDSMQALILRLAGVSSTLTLWGKKDAGWTWLGQRDLGLDVHRILEERKRIRRRPKRRRK